MFGKELPESVRRRQRLTTMTARPEGLPGRAQPLHVRAARTERDVGQRALPLDGARWSTDIAVVKSLHTEAINHEPAIIAVNTGNQLPGRPCLGSWLSYGLGSLNENLPTFVVMTSTYTNKSNVQALSARMWSSGFLPGEARRRLRARRPATRCST